MKWKRRAVVVVDYPKSNVPQNFHPILFVLAHRDILTRRARRSIRSQSKCEERCELNKYWRREMVDTNYVEEYDVMKALLATWSALVMHFHILYLVLQDALLHEQRISSSDGYPDRH